MNSTIFTHFEHTDNNESQAESKVERFQASTVSSDPLDTHSHHDIAATIDKFMSSVPTSNDSMRLFPNDNVYLPHFPALSQPLQPFSNYSTKQDLFQPLENLTVPEPESSDDSDRGRASKKKVRQSIDSDSTSGRKFVCEHAGCGKSFKRSGHLKRHRLVHQPQQDRARFACKEPGCTKNYSTKYDLTAHYRQVHEGVKLWKCTVRGCCRRFVKKDSLDKHLEDFNHEKTSLRSDDLGESVDELEHMHHLTPNETSPFVSMLNSTSMSTNSISLMGMPGTTLGSHMGDLGRPLIHSLNNTLPPLTPFNYNLLNSMPVQPTLGTLGLGGMSGLTNPLQNLTSQVGLHSSPLSDSPLSDESNGRSN